MILKKLLTTSSKAFGNSIIYFLIETQRDSHRILKEIWIEELIDKFRIKRLSLIMKSLWWIDLKSNLCLICRVWIRSFRLREWPRRIRGRSRCSSRSRCWIRHSRRFRNFKLTIRRIWSHLMRTLESIKRNLFEGYRIICSFIYLWFYFI